VATRCKQILTASLDRLVTAAEPVKKYVDTSIAHTSTATLLAPVTT
jgi:hypothetical protein